MYHTVPAFSLKTFLVYMCLLHSLETQFHHRKCVYMYAFSVPRELITFLCLMFPHLVYMKGSQRTQNWNKIRFKKHLHSKWLLMEFWESQIPLCPCCGLPVNSQSLCSTVGVSQSMSSANISWLPFHTLALHSPLIPYPPHQLHFMSLELLYLCNRFSVLLDLCFCKLQIHSGNK